MGASTRAAEQKRAGQIQQVPSHGAEPVSEAEIDAVMLAALRDAQVRPEFIYAYQKTHRLVTEENAQYLTDEELAEWDAAVDEYRQQVKARRRWRR